MRWIALAVALAPFLPASPPAAAQDDGLGPLLDRLRTAPVAEREAIRKEILARDPEPAALLAGIAEETTYPAGVETGRRSIDVPGAERPVEIYVPEAYDPARTWPLLVALHGTGGDSRQVMDPALPIARREGWFLVAPTLPDPDIQSAIRKASRTGFGWGDHRENLALLALDHVLRRYRIDPDRVHLLGVSQGGYGAWGIGLCHSHRWASALPYAGGIDYRENFGGGAADLLDQVPDGVDPSAYVPDALKKALGDGVGKLAGGGRRRDLLQNAMNLPIFFVHGARDDVVSPEGDRKSNEELKRLGYRNHRYVEKPDWGHLPADLSQVTTLVEEMVDWARRKERDPHPDRFVHFAPRADTGVAYHVDLDDFDEGARLEVRTSGNRIQIESKRVRALTVHLSDDVVRLSRSVRIEWNGRPALNARVPLRAEWILESYARWADPSRVYPARVELRAKGE